MIALIQHIYPHVNLLQLAKDDSIVTGFWGNDHFYEGKALMIQEGHIDD